MPCNIQQNMTSHHTLYCYYIVHKLLLYWYYIVIMLNVNTKNKYTTIFLISF
jgi:hypothetical protein